MKNIDTLKHPLQQHIITVLSRQEFARFKDLLPIKTDTNVMAYHIKTLLKLDIIKKQNDVYTISQNGIIYINNLTKNVIHFPLVACVILLQNSDGDILLSKLTEQPYINKLSLPAQYLDTADQNIKIVASRIITQKIGLKNKDPIHVGAAYIRVRSVTTQLSSTLTHVFRVTSDDVVLKPKDVWVQPHKLSSLSLAPGTESIVARSFFGDSLFFEEFEEQWAS